MLESLVAGVLNRTLGNYVENFDTKQLNIGIWSGDVTLKNLKLKKESLDALELPIDVQYGFLGQLTLQIPWSNLRGKPVKVIIEDAYLLATPMLVDEYDEEKIKERELSLKRKKLQDLDLIEENKLKLAKQEALDPTLDDQSKKQESFTESLITKIVDNLQVTIKNIHLRYEDASVFTNAPYSVGITLDELSAVSTDGTWVPSFVSLTNSFARKLLTLKSLSCYFNSYSTSLIDMNKEFNEEELLLSFKKLIAKESDDNENIEIFKNHHFLLRPVTGSGKITINKLGSTELDPHILSELFFKEFAVNLNSDQYRDILNTASNYRFYVKTFKFKKFRPPKSMKPMEHPREWFQYAARAVLDEIHEKNNKWSWEYFKERRDDRRAYIKYFKLKIQDESSNVAVDQNTREELQKLEDKISYEDIKLYRSLAKTQARRERIKNIKVTDENAKTTSGPDGEKKLGSEDSKEDKEEVIDPDAATQTDSTTPVNKGWFSGWWGSAQPENGDSDSNPEGNVEANDLIMTEEQKKELFEAIEFDEQQALTEAIDIPKDRVKLKLFASLEKGSFRIRNKTSNLAEVMWEGCNFQLFERPNSFLSKFTLQEFKVEDGDDSSTLYKHIVSIKPMQQNISTEADVDPHPNSEGESESREPFFQVSFESNPLDESADSKLMAKMKSMTIFYHAGFIEKVVKFFTPPKQHQDTISAIMNAAEATVEGITAQTKLGLRYALEEHKTLNAQLDLQTPLIILPLNPDDWKSPCGIIDAGHISVMSDLIDRKRADELKAKRSTDFNDMDWSKLKDLMYDKFNLHLHDAQFLIGPTIKSTIEQLHDDNSAIGSECPPPALILKNFNTNFLLQVSILPHAYNLTRFKVSGDVPLIKAKMSDYQYKVILQLFKKIIPEFDETGYVDDEISDGYFTDDGDSLLDVFHNALNENEFSDALSFIDSDDGNYSDHDNTNYRDSVDDHPLTSQKESRSTTATRQHTPTVSNPLQDTQHQFDFDFKVGVFNLSLLKCEKTAFNPPEEIVDLVCENFQMMFFKTAKNINVELSLSDVNFIDKIEKSGPEEYKKIVSSNNFTKNDTVNYQQNKKEDLVRVKYSRTQRIVEVNNEAIELYDSDLNLNIAAVKAIINRRRLLTIYTYIMTTFTDPNTEETPADLLRHNTEDNTESAPQMMNVTIGLERIIVILLDEHVKLATLQLNTGEINVLLLPEKMKVQFQLGALTLHDEVNEGSPRDSVSRRLISIDDNDLAEVQYETFDATTNTNLFSSSIKFKTGSMRINFVEEPCKKILGYVMNLLKMKGLFDSARDSNYSRITPAQLDNNMNNRMSYDILIKTPIIVFPKLDGTDLQHFDALTAYLGEFKASNSFEKVTEMNDEILTKIAASLTSTRLTSDFYFDGNKQFLEIIDGIDMEFNIDNGFSDPSIGSDRASSIITAKMSDSEMKLTEFQLEYLLQLVQTIPSVLQYDNETDLLKQIEEDAVRASLTVSPEYLDSPTVNKGSSEVFNTGENKSIEINENHLKLDFKFKAGKLALSIYNDTKNVKNIEDVEEHRLSRFSLNDIGIDFQMKENSHYSSNIHTRSFTIEDIRVRENNLFREIIPTVDHDNYQFMCKVDTDGPCEDKQITCSLNIDSPKMILALDYLFSLKEFIYKGFGMAKTNDENELDDNPDSTGDEDTDTVLESLNLITSTETKSRFYYSINVVDFSVILLSDPTVSNTEAIVLKLEQLLISSQKTTTILADNVGSFLCRMNDYEGSRLRIINDFSASFSFDSRNSTPTNLLSSVQIAIEPLLLRLSLSDIRLALNIINKAYELAGITSSRIEVEEQNSGYTVFTKEFRKKLTKGFYVGSINSSISGKSLVTKANESNSQAIIKAETLTADFEGLRLVILGDVHELPVIDMNINQFTVHAENWSTTLDLNAQIESYVNIFNYARSSWEPLLEPWKVGLHVSNTLGKDGNTLNVNVISREIAEVTLTSRAITLLSQMYSLVSLDANIAPRGTNTPYMILNQTGYDINVWIDSDDKKSRTNRKTIRQNQTVPWEFEDWTEIREKLDVDTQKNSIVVELIGSPYKAIESISLIGEGEELFMMTPPIQGVHNRLACSITLTKDNVKQIVLKSTLTVHNTSGVGILIGIGLASDRGVNEIYPVAAGELFSLPIDHVYKEALAVKPDLPNSSYGWSSSRIRWKSLYDKPSLLECAANSDKSKGDNVSFYFQVDAERYSNSTRKIYPHLKIVISSPLQIENLLPYDMMYRIYDKTIRKFWLVSLKKGSSSSIHFVNIKNLLLMSVEPLNCGFQKSEFVIIHAPEESGFPTDSRLDLKHDDGQKLHLNIDYGVSKDGNSNSGLNVTIYSPYIILNRTGQSLILGEKYNALHSIATSSLEDPNKMKSSQPKMFSFENDQDRQNRAFLSVSDSGWSREISLDAIGQFFDLSMPVNGRRTEINVGIDIKEGEGKYLKSKVVTISPRFIITNDLSEELNINEIGSSKILSIKPGESLPLNQTCIGEDKELRIRFLGSNSKWSSPFSVNDIGEIFLKILKQETGHILLKVVVILENATLFIRFEDAGNHWPYSIRNFSNTEFVFYQSNPYIDEQGAPVKKDSHFKPIFYKIPPKSVMPYAWDYPAGIVKELVLRSHGKDKSIQLAEIGNIGVMYLPQFKNLMAAATDINIVADGPTQALVISDADPSNIYSNSNSNSKTNSTTAIDTVSKIEAKEQEHYSMRVAINCKGMGISLINSKLQELCYITYRGLEIKYNESELYQTFIWNLKWVQVDNQLFGGTYPIVIYPSVVPQSSQEVESHPTFHFSVSRVKDDSHGVLYIKYATLLLQEITVDIDEDFLFAVLDFSKLPLGVVEEKKQDVLCEEIIELPAPSKSRVGQDIYFEALHLQPTQINLSFVRTERVNAASNKTDSQNPLMFFFNVLTMAIGNVNDAPIKLNALFIENIRVPIPILVHSIKTHYSQDFFFQLHKVLGSADFLGNPVGLFNNISSGVMDIFYEPYQGLIMNDRPQELGISIAKGGLSFLKKSVFGVSDSVAKFTGSVAKGLSLATLDKDYQDRRRYNLRRNRPKHALVGLKSGATSLFESLSSGVSGIALAPIEGASTEGTSGFFKGIGKGIVGFPTKAAIGVFDLASSVSEGIRNTTTAFDNNALEKVRLPRAINHDGIIRPYSPAESQGQYWLKTINGGEFSNSEIYLAHMVLPGGELVIMITFNDIMLISISKQEVKWKISFEEIKSIVLESTGIKIILFDNRPGPFVPIPDLQSKRYFYNRIAVAVNQYNKHSQSVL
ncbi:membrane morphogenesis protein [Saccharomycopsis crataegensis]|uniref:Membrane morphogenesis protein n=1 Tax=Saccharomycopsis crataegensis TaxID=43959 RepID=A0AAV5QGQ3_9ASCO|nr:membrane morphogenesis protein [Saccharomycopsis crataegensis]